MSIVCPYCLEPITTGQIRRECNICGREYVPTFRDSLLPRAGKVPGCRKKGCLGQYSVIKCGVCNHSLPNDIMQYERYIRFAVVAPTAAGKTSFITAMLEEAKQNRPLNFLFATMSRETQDYHRNNVEQMYSRLETVSGNTLGDVIPMQWRIQDLNRATKTTVPAYSMTIFDGAGEDQRNLDPLISRYIAGSKMIMLLIDPTKLAGVRSQMTADEISKAGGVSGCISREETQEFIEGLISYLKTACSLRVDRKIPMPVAVVFGKIDAVARNLGSAQVLTSSGHAKEGKFLQTEADNVHDEIDGWMDSCGDGLTKTFNANFKTWRYFGVSSFGQLPNDRRSINEPQPLRVLDPLIWDLALEGIVETA